MALDSNSPGDERGSTVSTDRAGNAVLKLVGERSQIPAAVASASSVERQAGAASDSGPGAPGAPPTPLPKTSGGRTAGRRLPLWLFIVLFVVFLIALGYQTRNAGRLESELARLEESLAQAESRLESHRTHLLEIRGGVHDLTTRLESLRLLIDRDPAVDAPTGPATDAPSTAPTEPDGFPVRPPHLLSDPTRSGRSRRSVRSDGVRRVVCEPIHGRASGFPFVSPVLASTPAHSCRFNARASRCPPRVPPLWRIG